MCGFILAQTFLKGQTTNLLIIDYNLVRANLYNVLILEDSWELT